LKHDYVFITKKGLEEFEMILDCRYKNYYRNRKIPREPLPYDDILQHQINRKEKKIDKFNDLIIKKTLEEDPELFDKPLTLLTRSLKGYVRELKAVQQKSKAEK